MNDPVAFSKYNLNTMKDVELSLSEHESYFKFTGREDMLDIGCASGRITKEIILPFVEKHLNKLLGVDIDQAAIDMGNKLYNGPNISFEHMDIDEEKVWVKYEEKFGHIFSFFLIQLLRREEIWSENIFKMLKRNGQFFTLVLYPPHPFALISAAQRADKTAPWAKYLEKSPDLFTDYGPNPSDTICNILRSAGFKIDYAEVHVSPEAYKTFEDLKGMFLSINVFLKHIPDELRDAYIEDYLKRLLEHVDRLDDGSYYYKKYALLISATKL